MSRRLYLDVLGSDAALLIYQPIQERNPDLA